MSLLSCFVCGKNEDLAPTGLATFVTLFRPNGVALCEQCALTALSIFQNKKPWLRARPADPKTLFRPATERDDPDWPLFDAPRR